MKFRCVDNDTVLYLQMRIVNVGETEHPSRIVLGIMRIDEEILNELKQKQLFENALQGARIADVAKNTFLSNMSHDMRTPLNAITG
ncbi:MAG: hybrid sensor histidine kinase/response regulator, partial [Clostridia bacterium]|nr:hybrid sensor histidine kinase/response regulator [Clostridia bacterium]